MSVLIKGMEMPEHCGYCRFRYDGICHALQKTQYSMDKCPLVPVPKHGRLIDADAPTADVPERNVGKWVFGFDEETGERDIKAWTCSLCGEKYPWQPNYCPHCGAKMVGKETEDDKSRMDK